MNLSYTAIESIKSEISWQESKEQDMEELLATCGRKFYSQIFQLSNGKLIKVNYDDPKLKYALEEKFLTVSAIVNADAELSFITQNKPALGYLSTNHCKALVVGDGFGILKSAMSGLISLQVFDKDQHTLPIHGSAFYHDSVGGILMIGGHRAGKTTGLLNLTNILGGGRVLSDDWLLADFKEKGIHLTTTDNSISISKQSTEENPHITYLQDEKLRNSVLDRKRSCQPSELIGSNFQNSIAEKVDIIILLSNQIEVDIGKVNTLEYVPEFIRAATYHYPYCNNGRMAVEHEEKWTEYISNGDQTIYGMNHEKFGPIGIQEKYRKLAKYLISNS